MDEYENDKLMWYEMDDNPQVESRKFKQDPDIYKLDYKEFQCLIYNKIMEIQSSIQSLLEVAKRK